MSIKHLFAFDSSKRHASWHRTKKLHHLSQMVVILRILLVTAISWLKKKISCSHFKHHASKWPAICCCIIFSPNYDLRWPILACLDFSWEVMICPATVSKITYLEFKILFEFRTSFLGSLLLNLLLHCLWIEHFFVKIKLCLYTTLFVLLTTWDVSFSPLTFFKLLSIEYKLLHLLLLIMNISKIILISMRNLNSSLIKVNLLLQ